MYNLTELLNNSYYALNTNYYMIQIIRIIRGSLDDSKNLNYSRVFELFKLNYVFNYFNLFQFSIRISNLIVLFH